MTAVLEAADLEPLPETRVAVDNLLEHGFRPEVLAKPDVEAELRLKVEVLEPYEMVNRAGERSLFGLESIDLSRAVSVPLTLGALESSLLSAWHPDCPLRDCETFAGQTLFPRHAPHIAFFRPERRVIGRVVAVDRERGTITVSGETGESEITATAGFSDWLPGADVGAFYGVDRSTESRLFGLRIRLPRRHRPSRVPDVVTRHQRRLDGRRRA